MTENNIPLVSIGMPVYNGEKYICQALDSLLAQDYENFELIISDNASTDGTGGICQEYAARDGRISYYRNDVNMGAMWNFKKVLELAPGRYFMWAAHDDVWKSEFLSACVEELQKNPGVVLCVTKAILIDNVGAEVGTHADNAHTLGMPKIDRLKKVIQGISRNTTFYGLYRKESLTQVSLKNFYGSDVVFMANLSILGEFIIRSEGYFLSRVGGTGHSVQKVMKALNIRSKFMENFPNISFFLNYLGAVLQFPELSFYERYIAFQAVIHRFTSKPYPKRIKRDLFEFARKMKNKVLA